MKRRICGVCFLLLCGLLSGCGRGDGGEKFWQGTLRRTAAEITVTDVRWTGFPAWEDWLRLTASGSREIAIRGSLTLPESPAVLFQCRLSRLEDRIYSVRFSGEQHERPLWVRGELDLKRKLLSVDFQGRFSAVQYQTFKLLPQLTSGMADLRGSVLFSGGPDRICNFPQLSIQPVQGAGLRAGPFQISCAGAERHEEFDGRVEMEFRNAASNLGGMILQFRKLAVNGRKGTFTAGVKPAPPWQCTVPVSGNGTFSLDEESAWNLTADLPEPGVFRCGKWIFPLTSCHLSGSGNGVSGTWDWQGEGSSATLQSDAGVGTGTGIGISGHREYRMADSVVTAESGVFSCRHAELPFAGGRLTVRNLHQEIRQAPAGALQWPGRAEQLCLSYDGKALQFTHPEWDVPLVAAGNCRITPEAGKWRAAAVGWTGGPVSLSGTQWLGGFLLRERDWECTFVPQKIAVKWRGNTLTQSGGRFSLQGGRDGSGAVRLSAGGSGAALEIPGTEIRCGEWSATAGILQYGTSCGEAQIRSRNWIGPGWQIAEFSLEKAADGSGWAVLDNAEMTLGAWSFRGLHAKIPLGQSAGNGGSLTAAAADGPGREFAQLSAELRPGADILAVKGRAAVPKTGGSAFFQGAFRMGDRTGKLEYSIPAATLLKELSAAEIVPLFKSAFLAGKIGENGKFVWENGHFTETRNLEFSGSIRSDVLMADAVNGTIALKSGSPAAARMLFGRFVTGALSGTDGDLAVQENAGAMQVSAIRFQAWGGRWKWLQGNRFAVEKVQADSLLPEKEWSRALSGTFSGTVELAPDGAVVRAELAGEGPGRLRMEAMERFRHVSGMRQDPVMVEFSAAAMRDFQYRTLHLRLLRRGKSRYLRLAADGRPAAPVPFVYSGKTFRHAVSGEAGFEDNVELSCWYRMRDGSERK